MPSATHESPADVYLEGPLQLEDEGEEAAPFHPAANQTSLLRRLNDARALTKSLPTEIMCLIFQYIYTETPESLRPNLKCVLALGHISSYWRQILWSTPHIWTRMTISITPRSANSTLHILRLHLQNVGDLLFSLQMTFFPSRPLTDESLGALLKLLVDKNYSEKIHSLTLSRPPRALALCLSNGTFPHIESLDLSTYSAMGKREFSITNHPYLSKLRLVLTAPTTIGLSWPIITSLSLDSIPFDISMGLFVECPNLVEAHIRQPEAPTSHRPFVSLDSSGKTIRRHLKRLTWSWYTGPTCLSVFERIRAPALQEFTWCNSPDVPWQFLLPILLNFPPMTTLTRLGFTDLENTRPYFFEEIFSRTKHLPALEFKLCDYDTVESAVFVLGPDITYLPSLNELSIVGEMMDVDVLMQRKIGELLKRRWDNRVVRRFLLKVPTATVWDPEVPIGGLIEEGFLQVETCDDLLYYDSESESGD